MRLTGPVGARPRTDCALTSRRGHDRQRVCSAAAPAAPAPVPVASSASKQARPVPRSIHDVDNGIILGFGKELGPEHPGYHDAEYKQRRAMIADVARSHRLGDPIPLVEYTDAERAVWGHVLGQLKELAPQHACSTFLRCLPRCDFRANKVPQLQELSEMLQGSTGWRIRPVAGLMHPRDFLAGLAFKHFHSTQYVRHPSQPSYTPEPDLCHELVGHVPMLADQAYADFVQAIGQASLGADDKTIQHLTRVYWFTVEFGVVREPEGIRAFGAGILSSFGELQHMASGAAQLLPFDAFAPQPKMSYKDGYQKAYFVLDSFEDACRQIQALAQTCKRAA